MIEQHGFHFNERAAFGLVNVLKTKRAEIHDQLQEVFPPIVQERISDKTGKRLKDKVVLFNPGSRQQTARRLRERYPEISFSTTEKGNEKVDDDVLEKLGEKYPEAKLLGEYQMLNKRLGQIVEGKEAWLKHSQVFEDSRIHGTIITNACSVDAAHIDVPILHKFRHRTRLWSRMQISFRCTCGWVLWCRDASAGASCTWCSMAHFDGGEYAGLVSTDGFDIHTYNAKLFGIYDGEGDIPKSTRDLAKD